MAEHNGRKRIVKRKKKRLAKKRIAIVLVPILLICAAGLVYFTSLYKKAEDVLSDSHVNDGRDKSELRQDLVDPSEDHVSILLIGVDASEIRDNSDHARSDTLILATLNKSDHSVKMVSIPRDSYVYVPEVGRKTKINHAHAYGGTQATIETVEQLLDIPVDYWAKVNFDAFIDVVDAINGVTIDVPYELYEQNSQDVANAIHLLPGRQLLDGEEALALSRTRKLDNDIERGKRQQEIIKAVVKKSASLNSFLKFDDIIEAVGKNMTTNMTFSEMKNFISYGTKGNLNFDTMSLEGNDLWVYEPQKAYYWELDALALDQTKQELQNHLELEPIVSDSPSTTYDQEIAQPEEEDSVY
ncbi:LCP family protein [Lentibacillus saliphilus]|uniref:LCP family protein n=1 Tax=Lentibacillus saliphilus TaxID=2737028 RepID=UPI001C30CC3D|nr:LCP family protein [Lentibacillus saliphilus]